MGNPRPGSRGSGDGPSVPAATVAELSACAEQGAARLTDTHYAIMFDVDVKADGEVDAARIRESMIGDREIESCMTGALRGMSLPGVVTPLRASGPVYGAVSSEDRAPMGHPAAAAAAGAAVNLIPIVLIAAGVTIVVAVTVHVGKEVGEAIGEAISSTGPTPLEIEEMCLPWLHHCLENKNQPKNNWRTYGREKPCGDCYGECKHRKGTWPDNKCPRWAE